MALRMPSGIDSSAIVFGSPSASPSWSIWASRSAISFWESFTVTTLVTSLPGLELRVLLVNQVVRGNRRGDKDRDDVDDLDHGVDGGTRCVLVRIAGRIASDGGLVSI